MIVASHRSLRLRGLGAGLAGAAAGLGGGEQLELDPALVEPARLQGLGHLQHHVLRPADEGGVDGGDVEPVGQQRLALGLVDPAVEQVDVLLLAAEDVDQREAVEVGVLEVLELLAEHDRAGGAVAVDQREAAVRLGRERGLDDAEQRRDPAAGGEAEIVVAGLSGRAAGGSCPWAASPRSASPGTIRSLAQVENRPPSIFLMPTRSSASCAAAQIE